MVNWMFGGDLVVCQVNAKEFETEHSYNIFDGEVFDATRIQFQGMGISTLSKMRIVDSEKLLKNQWEIDRFTAYRMNILKAWSGIFTPITPIKRMIDAYPTNWYELKQRIFEIKLEYQNN